MYLIYPEGNWVEVRSGTPYVIIGASRYGKPILDRAWRYDRSLSDAMLLGLLAFDATRTSASDVDYPVDTVLYRPDSFELREARFDGADMAPMRETWQQAVLEAVERSAVTTEPLFARLDGAAPAKTRYGDVG